MKYLLVVALLIMGCHSNPYPDEGILVENKPARVLPTFALDFNEVVELQEGTSSEINIKGFVPSGNPLITFEGLPAGATFDSVNSKIIWMPGYDAANNPMDPSITRKIYPVVIILKDANNPVSVYKKTLTLVVSDTPRLFQILGASPYTDIKEGQFYTQNLKINSEDYPNGPFVISGEKIPEGAVIEQDKKDPKLLHIFYIPSFDQSSNQKSWILHVYDPRGREVYFVFNWTIIKNIFEFDYLSEESEIREGEAFEQIIRVRSDDFPQGPFTFKTFNLPDGSKTEINPQDPSKFKVKFTPDFGFVNITKKQKIEWSVQVSDPKGRMIKSNVLWAISANRQKPQVFIPNKINQGPPIVNFMINVINPNGDDAPAVTVTTPTLGKVITEEVSTGTVGGKPFKNFSITWKDIPQSEVGKKSSLEVKVCIKNTTSGPDLCTTSQVPIFLNGGN